MEPVETAERELDHAEQAMARRDVDALVAHLSAAVRAFAAASLPCRAALTCARLGEVYATLLGNMNAARAWFTRAWRLVEHEPPCLEQGWVAVAAMGCDVDDPALLWAAATFALERARRFGDVNLETKALADGGLARVQEGRVLEGMALLDEAMALACGPADDVDTAAKSVCSFFTACYYAADFARADSWAVLLRRHGLIGNEPGGPAFLSSHCDSVQATLLAELGRWGDAEALLLKAKHDFESLVPGPAWHPDIALADLRVRQGRLAEAELLLLGKDQSIQALLPAAHLHLARGDVEMARATATRGLRALRADRLRSVELLAVLVDVELSSGDVGAARSACTELDERVHGLGLPALEARAARAQAQVEAAEGRSMTATTILETAVNRLDPATLPWLRATLLLDLAELRSLAGDTAGATVDARAAEAALDGLDVVLTSAQQRSLARLGCSSPSPTSSPRAELVRDATRWRVAHGGVVASLADTKGLRYLAELLARPGQERHVFDLVDALRGPALTGEPDRRSLGDAGELLDSRARATYRWRVEQLRAEADDAIAAGLLERAEHIEEEIDALVRELARAFGIGGRDRRAASAAERARLNVTRALRSAVDRLTVVLPEAGSTLQRRIRTGTYCAYEPVDGEIVWMFSAE